MSTATKLTGTQFDKMVESGAFGALGPIKVELINGDLRFLNPAGPVHDDYIEFLTNWSVRQTRPGEFSIHVQAGFICDDDRPEPDVVWLRPRRYGRARPTAADVTLLIEVADSSLANDLREKADLYAAAGVVEYCVIDIPNRRLHVMSNASTGTYQSIEIVVPPNCPAPKCKPEAQLDISALFSVH